jgi:hypothetical protein
MRTAARIVSLLVIFAATIALAMHGFRLMQRAQDGAMPMQIMTANVGSTENPLYSMSRDVCGEPCTVTKSYGGLVTIFEVAAREIAADGRHIRIDGECYSSCTILVDRLAATGNVCMTDRAVLQVHQMMDPDGKRRPIKYETPGIKSAVSKYGQPTNGFLKLLRGDLGGAVPACT